MGGGEGEEAAHHAKIREKESKDEERRQDGGFEGKQEAPCGWSPRRPVGRQPQQAGGVDRGRDWGRAAGMGKPGRASRRSDWLWLMASEHPWDSVRTAGAGARLAEWLGRW